MTANNTEQAFLYSVFIKKVFYTFIFLKNKRPANAGLLIKTNPKVLGLW